jgi:hypothetical protein
MLLGELDDILALSAGVLRLPAPRAAELEINRLLGFERRQPLKPFPAQHRRFQRQLRCKTGFDFPGDRRGPALIVNKPRAARTEEVDSVRSRTELEWRSGRDRNENCAP